VLFHKRLYYFIRECFKGLLQMGQMRLENFYEWNRIDWYCTVKVCRATEKNTANVKENAMFTYSIARMDNAWRNDRHPLNWTGRSLMTEENLPIVVRMEIVADMRILEV
jgi:hypothetical protein